MSSKWCQSLAVVFSMMGMLVMSVTMSPEVRQKRADDGEPLQTVVERLSAQVDDFSAQLGSVNAQVAALKTKTDNTVAFHAWSDVHPVRAAPHHIIILGHVITNLGNGYDRLTGIFTAPVAGVYHLQATVMADDSHSIAYGQIIVDNKHVATAVSDRSGSWEQATMNCIIHLNVGQTAYLRNPSSGMKAYHGSPSDPYTTFSGFLLQAD